MYQTIIVPLDGSPTSELALPVAIKQALGGRKTLVLLRIVPRPEPPCPDPRVRCGGPPLRAAHYDEERAARDAQEARAYLAGICRTHGLPPETVTAVRVGNPVAWLARVAAEWPNPLMVMTTSGDDHADCGGLGHVPAQVLHRRNIPVLGVPVPGAVAPAARVSEPARAHRPLTHLATVKPSMTVPFARRTG